MTFIDELQACTPLPVQNHKFNPACTLPYDLTINHIQQSMEEFNDFLGFVNGQLYTKEIPRIEGFLMPANFSGLVGEFMNVTIPKHCAGLVKNLYPNGHPDLIPCNRFTDDSIQYTNDGVEIKASRRNSGWQGHNPEAVWLMVFHFDSNTANDRLKDIPPKSFKFKAVYAAKLDKDDWNFSGRSATSRRTITASVNKVGMAKMKGNWIYMDLQV